MGIRLKEMRQRAGYKSQTDAAKAFGISYLIRLDSVGYH